MTLDEFMHLDYAEQQDLVQELDYDTLWSLQDEIGTPYTMEEELAYDLLSEEMLARDEDEGEDFGMFEEPEDE